MKTKNILFRAFVLFLSLLLQAADATAKSQNLTIDGDHGKLSVVLQTPDGAAKSPLVMILHGFGARKEMPLLSKIADNLEQAGISSVRFDFNGHGDSDGDFRDMTVENEIADAEKVFAYVSALPETASVSVAGHSQGGVVASVLAGRKGADEIKAEALLAPSSNLRDDIRKGELFGVKFDTASLPEYLDIANRYKVGRRYLEAMRDLPVYEEAARFRGPALIFHGTGDRIVPYACGERYHAVLKNSELATLEGADHLYSGHTDEVARIVADFFIRTLNK